jgi:hypothetical protein
MGNHTFWVDSKEDMLNMAKDPSKIGSIIVLDKCPYTLIGSFGITSDNNILKNKSIAMEILANWMWAAKLDGEGARMYEACEALCDALIVTGTAVDGGEIFIKCTHIGTISLWKDKNDFRFFAYQY